MRFFLILFTTLLLSANLAAAQNANGMAEKLQAALQQNDAELALKIAADLYTISDESSDHQSAGFAAYVKAGILEQTDDHLDAAKAYGQCRQHYLEIDSAAQSIQCDYKSALAYLAGYQDGRAIDALKSTAKSLEGIGQGKSALAA